MGNAIDALLEDQVVRPNYKIYYLGEYTYEAAQKTISGLLGLRTEDVYKRARKTLKERFGDTFRIYEANWTPCSTDLREFSHIRPPSVASHLKIKSKKAPRKPSKPRTTA